jgi:uncharacterized protein YehS (DUF1456 family)
MQKKEIIHTNKIFSILRRIHGLDKDELLEIFDSIGYKTTKSELSTFMRQYGGSNQDVRELDIDILIEFMEGLASYLQNEPK